MHCKHSIYSIFDNENEIAVLFATIEIIFQRLPLMILRLFTVQLSINMLG